MIDEAFKTYVEGKKDVDVFHGFTGFTVYDSKTGYPVEDKAAPGDSFMLSQDGTLFRITDGWHDGNRHLCREVEEIPRTGEYIIQLGTGEYFRW